MYVLVVVYLMIIKKVITQSSSDLHVEFAEANSIDLQNNWAIKHVDAAERECRIIFNQGFV